MKFFLEVMFIGLLMVTWEVINVAWWQIALGGVWLGCLSSADNIVLLIKAIKQLALNR